jgi:hypothetical protein
VGGENTKTGNETFYDIISYIKIINKKKILQSPNKIFLVTDSVTRWLRTSIFFYQLLFLENKKKIKTGTRVLNEETKVPELEPVKLSCDVRI